MEHLLSKQTTKRWKDRVSRFKYPALVLLVGVLLMLWPSKQARQSEPQAETEAEQAELPAALDYRAQTEQQLESILSSIEGAGRVRVMLTLQTGQSTQYQSDYETTAQPGEHGTATAAQQKTVMISRGSSYTEPVVVKSDYPVFLGALIVSEGAADATVRLALGKAVSALLGLGMDKITVVKMK